MAETATPHPTATSLLDAGTALAEKGGLATMTVDAVVAEAGTGKGTFYRHFKDQESFLVALQQRFFVRVASAVLAAAAELQPGRERILQVLPIYLDSCLEQRGVKAFLTEARAVPAVEEAVAAGLRAFAEGMVPDLEAMKVPQPPATAQLIAAMAHEVAVAEQAAGRRLPQLRAALLRLAGV